ncbi:hypothetical protein [Endozoicomonas sp.]|uniref:hypothetical protein n=1 Tax=Endozoicomonas sp. TaxID=1892382 RepID=UPI0028878A6D|nr:hypothetical protein [Endozoicomonas sp.]
MDKKKNNVVPLVRKPPVEPVEPFDPDQFVSIIKNLVDSIKGIGDSELSPDEIEEVLGQSVSDSDKRYLSAYQSEIEPIMDEVSNGLALRARKLFTLVE